MRIFDRTVEALAISLCLAVVASPMEKAGKTELMLFLPSAAVERTEAGDEDGICFIKTDKKLTCAFRLAELIRELWR